MELALSAGSIYEYMENKTYSKSNRILLLEKYQLSIEAEFLHAEWNLPNAYSV